MSDLRPTAAVSSEPRPREQQGGLGMLRSLIHSLTDGVFQVDAQGLVSVWSETLAELVGVEASEVLGHAYGTALDAIAAIAPQPGGVRPDLEHAVRVVDEQPVVYVTAASPQPQLLQVRLFPVQDEAGSALGWGGLVRDLTRTDEINVLTTVAHELRSPLAAIKGHAATLLDNYGRWDASTVEEFLQVISNSTDELSRLVENILDLSRLEAKRLSLQRRSVRLDQLAAEMADQLRPEGRGRRFEVDFPPEFPAILADQLRVRQVLGNLLQNARKFSPAHTLIRITGEYHGDTVSVRVFDQGPGVPADEQERIFERFYQASNTADAQGGGLGLGLYISRRIVEAHGGRLWVEDPPVGPGSVFVLELPVAAPASAPAPRPDRGPAINRPPDEVRVLVVEDDRRLVRFIRANLEAGGYEVLAAGDGETALEAISREVPDLVLLDVGLPRLDGYEVLGRLREFTGTPVIMLTGRTEEADRVRGLDLGADDYLSKPFGVKELLARVRAALRRGNVQGEMPARSVLAAGALTIDFARREVRRDDQRVDLTPTEYKLLYTLAANPGQVLTHTQLLRKVWGAAYESETSYLWVYISRLRKKLEPDTEHPRHILSEPGVGYRFVAE